MRKIIFIILCSFCLTFNAYAAVDWDLLDEDCADISDWSNADTNGVSSQITFDSKSCFKFYIVTAGAGNKAQRYLDLGGAGSLTGDYTIEIKWYFDTIGANSSIDRAYWSSEGPTYGLFVDWGTDGLRIYDGSGWNIISGITVTQDEWHTWRFEVHNSQTDVDIYLDNILQTSDADCSSGIVNNEGMLLVVVSATTLDASLAYTDWIRIDTGVGTVVNDIGLRFYDGSSIIKIGTLPATASHKLRIYDGSVVQGIPLVATGTSDDSNIRIYDGASIKSLSKILE